MVAVCFWEFTQKVKSKSFLFSIVFMPTIIVGFTLLPTYLATHEQDKPLAIAVADEMNLTEALRKKLRENKTAVNLLPLEMTSTDSVMINGIRLVRDGMVDGFMVLDETVLASKSVSYFSKESVNSPAFRYLDNTLHELLIEREFKKRNWNSVDVNELVNGFHIKAVVLDSNPADETEKYITGIIVVMMLFFSISNSSGSFLRGLSEEKNNRVIEILISSAAPRELMTGKILGLGLVGLLQLGIWIGAGIVFGGNNVFSLFTPSMVFCFVVYFGLGYLLFASIFAIVGSVLSSEHDIQPVQSILSILGILPVAFAILVLQNPDSLIVNIGSYVPLLTPTLMILRMVISTPPMIHIVGTMIVLLVSLIIALRAASKVFEVALLMYGKKLTFSEVWKWI
jgi:ABC-2 type transport system permease protein